MFASAYHELVYRPLLNVLHLLYQYTGEDIGIAIVILGIIVNLVMWPLFAQAFINGQKTKALQPLTSEIRSKYKDDPQEMIKKLGEFNKEHNIRGGSVFYVLIFQLLFASGIWRLTRQISELTSDGSIAEIGGLYEWVAQLTNTEGLEATFNGVAFGFLQIGETARLNIWLPLIAAFFSFAYGYYTFKLAPKPKVIPTKKKKVSKKNKEAADQPPALDPEALQKSLEFQSIYILPVFMFALNMTLTTGVNIYFAVVTLLSLVRQIFLTNYFAGHTDELVDRIIKSDPSFKDDDKSNNFEITANGDITSQDEVAEKILEKDLSRQSKATKSKNQSKKKTSKKDPKKSKRSTTKQGKKKK